MHSLHSIDRVLLWEALECKIVPEAIYIRIYCNCGWVLLGTLCVKISLYPDKEWSRV